MYFDKHVFVCENVRESGRECCAHKGSVELRALLKSRAKEHLRNAGVNLKVRVNAAGCLDRCEEGPVVVVYPAGHWFRLQDAADVERFVAGYLEHGDPEAIADLRLPDERRKPKA